MLVNCSVFPQTTWCSCFDSTTLAECIRWDTLCTLLCLRLYFYFVCIVVFLYYYFILPLVLGLLSALHVLNRPSGMDKAFFLCVCVVWIHLVIEIITNHDKNITRKLKYHNNADCSYHNNQSNNKEPAPKQINAVILLKNSTAMCNSLMKRTYQYIYSILCRP